MIFTVGSTSLLFFSTLLLTVTATKSAASVGFASPISASAVNYQPYSAVPQVLAAFSDAEIKDADARPTIIDNFLNRYKSPFKGLGQFITDTADKYQIPYSMIPAISQCESNVGKVIPPDSFNAWGYGIYGDTVLRFNNWFEAIDRVSRGLREDYYSQGLDTPQKIMTKYTPSSNGSWAQCVEKALLELQ